MAPNDPEPSSSASSSSSSGSNAAGPSANGGQQASQPPAQFAGGFSQFPLPEKFASASRPGLSELWPAWKKRFQRYRVASGLGSRSNPEQVSALLYAMGEIVEAKNGGQFIHDCAAVRYGGDCG